MTGTTPEVVLTGELDIATEIMRVEDSLDVPQTVAGEGRDLRHSCIGQSEPHDGRAAQVVERQAGDAGLAASLCP